MLQEDESTGSVFTGYFASSRFLRLELTKMHVKIFEFRRVT